MLFHRPFAICAGQYVLTMNVKPDAKIQNVASIVPQGVTYLTPVTATVATPQGLVSSQVYTIVSLPAAEEVQGKSLKHRHTDVIIPPASKDSAWNKKPCVTDSSETIPTIHLPPRTITPPASLKDFVVSGDKAAKSSTLGHSSIPTRMTSPAATSTGVTSGGIEPAKMVADAAKGPVTLDSLAEMLRSLQTVMNAGINDITQKLTDPVEGLVP